uniref:N-acetyltransferase domain-containing protein n=1 Tax=Chenopodium quinoa TaxID=63459 RepID=A0A803N2D4_CHEQI
MEIVEYKRKRKEFNPVHLKKPRSKIKTHKRNNINHSYVLQTGQQVAEIKIEKLGELVGVVRGCIKEVGFGLRRSNLKMGYILGLQVSPRHWHMGIGLNLMNAIEEWLANYGAESAYQGSQYRHYRAEVLDNFQHME